MSNFKSGSGNLDFGDDDESPDSEPADEAVPSSSDEESPEPQPDQTVTERAEEPVNESTTSSPADQYPYFVRRNNVATNVILASKSTSVTR
jgi:hypothetical protein